MRKIISLFISIIIAFSINGLDNAFKSELPIVEEKIKVDNIIDSIQDDKKLEEKSEIIEESEQKVIESSKEPEKKQEIISDESTINNDGSIKKEENIVQNNVVETQIENTKKNNPWDSLGITEYEFYHKPASSWAEVNFKISDYGSYEATFNACKEYGDNYKAEHGGGYWCISVNSYSGDYLGEDIDFY